MRNTVLITIAAALIAVALLFVPVDPPAQMPPGDAAAPAATADPGATPPPSGDPAATPEQPTDPPVAERDVGELDADCNNVGERMSKLGTPAFAERIKVAAQAKYSNDQIRALCHRFEVLDDAGLLAAIKEEYGLTP
jgi:hypothetical protein